MLGERALKVQKASIGITQVSGEMGVNAMSMLAGTTSTDPGVSRVLQLLNMVTADELMDNDDYEGASSSYLLGITSRALFADNFSQKSAMMSRKSARSSARSCRSRSPGLLAEVGNPPAWARSLSSLRRPSLRPRHCGLWPDASLLTAPSSRRTFQRYARPLAPVVVQSLSR